MLLRSEHSDWKQSYEIAEQPSLKVSPSQQTLLCAPNLTLVVTLVTWLMIEGEGAGEGRMDMAHGFLQSDF